jgi:hypothetical protein
MPSATAHGGRFHGLDVLLLLVLVGLALPLTIAAVVEVTWMARLNPNAEPIPRRIVGVYFVTALLSGVTAPAAVLLGALGSFLPIFSPNARIASRAITAIVVLAWIVALVSPP